MGYYTDFYLMIKPDQEIPDELLEEYIDDGGSTIEDIYESSYSANWIEWEREMIDISKKYPKLEFTLDGNGDDVDDVWRAFFKNGKNYYWCVEAHRPEFDEDLLE